MKSFTTTQDMVQYEVSQDYCEPYLGATHDDLQAARFNKYDTHIDKNEFFIYDDMNHKYNIYHRVEYIENTTTAYIDPQYITNANSIIEIKVQLTATAAQNRIIGNTSGYFECYINGSSKWGFTSNGNLYVSNIAANTELHTFKIDNNALKGYIDVTQINITKNAASYYNNAYLISRNGSSTCKCKIYYSKIYNGNTLVRDFIPVKNTLTNQYGLLDTVEQKFYVSPNGVEFNGGNEIIEDKNGVQYRKKEYIENTNNAYIETGVYPSNSTKIILKFINKVATGGVIVGYQSPESNEYRFFNASNKTYFDIGNQRYMPELSILSNKLYELEIGNYYILDILTGTKYSRTVYNNSAFSGAQIYLNRGSGSVSQNRYYYVSIYNDNILVRNYIPVQRISDSKYGLFDTINNKFYYSPDSAQFTGG